MAGTGWHCAVAKLGSIVRTTRPTTQTPPSALQDSAGIIEKDDLIAKVKEVAAAGPEGEAPAGYSFDAATGYWHSAGAE